MISSLYNLTIALHKRGIIIMSRLTVTHDLFTFDMNCMPIFLHVRGVSTSFRNHPKVKEPETSFLYSIHKTSLKSHYAKLHIPPILY